MKFAEFVLMVERMRQAQRQYYQSRTQSNLVAAKEQEKAVDKSIADFHREFDGIVRAEQAQLPTEFQPKVHPPDPQFPF